MSDTVSKVFLKGVIFKTVISTERLNDCCLSEFCEGHAQTLLFRFFMYQETNRILFTIIYNIIEEARETFTDCILEVHIGA